MKKWKDILGLLLLFGAVGAIVGGVRGVSGGEAWGGPAIGAGAVANVLAYRVMRSPPTPKRADEVPTDRGEPRA